MNDTTLTTHQFNDNTISAGHEEHNAFYIGIYTDYDGPTPSKWYHNDISDFYLRMRIPYDE